ncbi:hypothetical protein, partial [Synechococcus lacustris]|uniref:hypothetical protein n=1 Tax=Synechococcus lacustris TaxID=2116544 RepID=UPI0019D4DBE9
LSYKLASLVCVLCVLFSAYFKNLSVLNSCLLIFLAQYSVAMSSCIIGASYSLDVLRRVYVHKENRKFSIPLSISFSFYRKIQSTLFSGFLLSINKTLESPLELFAFRLLTDQYLLGVYKLMRQLLGFMLIYETIKYQKILTRSVSSSVKSVRVACLQIMPKLEISLFLIFISFPLFICAILGSSMKERLLQSSADLSLFIVIYSAIIVSAINMKSITPFALLASAGRYVQLTFAFAVLFIFLILSIIFSFYAILPPIPLIFFMQYGYLARLILYNRLNLKYI